VNLFGKNNSDFIKMHGTTIKIRIESLTKKTLLVFE